VESDVRFYRRRASEELAAAGRAVTEAARERRMILAGIFLDRLKSVEAAYLEAERGLAASDGALSSSAFKWGNGGTSRHA
jgi:hypothetical protein